MKRIAINAMAMGKTRTGVARFISELLNSLARVDRRNEYLVYTTPWGREHLHLGENFQVHTPSMPRPVRLIWEQTMLPALVRRHGIHLLHGQGFTLPCIRNSRSVVTIYDMTWFSHASTHQGVKAMYFKALIPRSVQRADHVVAISESANKDLVDMFPQLRGKVTTTLGGVASIFFDAPDSPELRQQTLKKYAIEGPYILSVGMIQPRKNLPRLIQAFARLRQTQNIPHKLVIVGKRGWQVEQVFEALKASGVEKDTVFTDFVPDDDLVHLYRQGDLLAYPSLYEGFGLPIVEAMAAGAPVVTSRSSSMEEVAGNAATLCDPDSVESIASAIGEVLADPQRRSQMIAEGRTQAAKFTWQQTARSTLHAYESALGESL